MKERNVLSQLFLDVHDSGCQSSREFRCKHNEKPCRM